MVNAYHLDKILQCLSPFYANCLITRCKVKQNFRAIACHKQGLQSDGRPWFAVEAKLNDTSLSPHLLYFKKRLSIPYVYQVVKKNAVDRLDKGTRMISAGKFLSGLM